MSEIRRTNWPAQRGSSARMAIPDGSSSGSSSSDADLTVISTRPPVGGDIELPAPVATLEIGKILEGEQLGQFVLEQFIGGGGMGAVFRALDTTLNREVAVKVLSRSQSSDEETLRRFQNEAQSAARLDHENIARVYMVGEDRGVHFIVFEYIDGVNLRDLVDQQGPLPLEDAIRYTVQLSEALSHASQRDVIHRDIKPSNVLITRDFKAKLVDMGLARLHQVEHPDNDLTASGVTLGTFDYISPEQARDPRSADVRSDLYSLGCSLYFMLTGRPPFPDGTVLQKLLHHQQDVAADPRDLRPDVPVELVRMVQRLLAKNPDDRFQHPSELVAALAELSEQLGLPPVAAPAAPWAPPIAQPVPWNKHLPWVVPFGSLVLIVIALDFYWSRIEASDEAIGPPRIQSTINRNTSNPNRNLSATGNTPATLTNAAPVSRNSSENTVRSTGSGNSAASVRNNLTSWLSELSREDFSTLATTVREILALRSSSLPATTGDDETMDESTEMREGLLIVSDRDEGPNSYTTLQAACAAAKSGDVIELRFNGRREQAPISLANTKVRIFSGVNYQPVLAFRPAAVDPARQSRSMISVVGGQLTLVNVHLELDIPQLPSDQWALIEVRQAELVRLEKCSLTIRNPASTQMTYNADVAFFGLRSGVAAMADMPTTMSDFTSRIELQNVIARGEATLLRNDEAQRVRLDWENGFLATSQRLLHLAATSASPTAGPTEISVRHLTAACKSGLLLLANGGAAEQQPMVDVKCSDSIFVAAPTSALIEQTGVLDTELSRRHLRWNGDRNFYEGFDSFWRISTISTPASPDDLPFNAWQAYWGSTRENLPRWNVVAWQQPPDMLSHQPQQSFHDMIPESYALSRKSVSNLARNGAGDGKDAGFLADALPLLPVPVSQSPVPAVDNDEDFEDF